VFEQLHDELKHALAMIAALKQEKVRSCCPLLMVLSSR
jgi:hypothetical protein